jgi:hypothetical protein
VVIRRGEELDFFDVEVAIILWRRDLRDLRRLKLILGLGVPPPGARYRLVCLSILPPVAPKDLVPNVERGFRD